MKSKIHRVKVTRTDIDYNGSITVDRELCVKADLPIIVSCAQYTPEECEGRAPAVICMRKSAPDRTGHAETPIGAAV
ncbi:MAG: hypothetical protein FD189_2523 [Elusimicrobia bacterium]|nr:MAG: hypothetical protein FD189_2523 [Elusimicrobiota bacterium]